MAITENKKGPLAGLFLCTGCTVCRGAMDGKERRMYMDGQADICSCNICTSTIRGGRIPQGARRAVRCVTDNGHDLNCDGK